MYRTREEQAETEALKFYLNTRMNFFTVQVTAHEQAAQRGCGVSLTGHIQEPPGYNPVPCALG